MLAMVDMDGSLIDTRDINYKAYSEALDKYNYKVDYETFCKDFNGLNYKVFLRMVDPNISEEVAEDIHNLKASLYPKYMKFGKLNESLVAILAALKTTGWKIALVSAANKKNIYDALERFSIIRLFDKIVTAEDVKTTKPDPECYISTMKLFNETPTTSIIFEDSQTGITAAEKSGCKFYVVKGYN